MTNLLAASSLLQRHLHRRTNYLCGSNTKLTWGGFIRTFGNDCDEGSGSSKTTYFHVSPSGDWWTGPSIFAAKHLQPDYVRSIPMPPGFDPNLIFGEENDEDDQDECDGRQHCEQHQTTLDEHKKETTSDHNTFNTQPPKLKLSWKEKQKLLYEIYDERGIPAHLLTDCSLDGKDGTN